MFCYHEEGSSAVQLLRMHSQQLPLQPQLTVMMMTSLWSVRSIWMQY